MTQQSSTRFQAAAMAVSLFLAYLAVTMPLPVLAVHITDAWGLSNLLAGLGVGSSFFTTIVFRKYTGELADRMGGKPCFLLGVSFYAVASVLCVFAAWSTPPVAVRYTALVFGRLLLGVGESMVNTGMVSWYVPMVGVARSGKVMSVVGMSMYAAFALGGPLGYFVYREHGFAVLMLLAATLPIAAFLLVWRLKAYRPQVTARNASLGAIMGKIWKYGLAVCMQGVGVSVIGAFLSQTFVRNGWPMAGWGLSCFGVGYVLLRALAGHLPDRFGGTPVALASFVLETAGLAWLWLAPGPWHALAGAFVTGCGCSMIYPALGRQVVVETPTELRGASIGCFAGFQDLAYALTGPVAGFLADRHGVQIVFLFAGLAAACGLLMALSLYRRREKGLP